MKLLLSLLLVYFSALCYGQAKQTDRKFSATELKTDLSELKQQLYTVHAYPFTELSRSKYDQLFADIAGSLTDSLTATDFLKKIKPLIAYLCDEHAQANLDDKLLLHAYQEGAVFLPFGLVHDGHTYRIANQLLPNSVLQAGLAIKAIDGKPVAGLVKACALFSSGYPEQRLQKALQQFGYLYTWTLPGVQQDYEITTADDRKLKLTGVTLKTWKDEISRQTGWNAACDENISYQKFNNVGYITACSFNVPQKQLDSIHRKIDDIFKQVQQDEPKYLFIDISKNSGGQSAIGNMLIDDFYDQSYRGYGMDFRKSEAYVKLLKSWKIEAADWYKAAPEGKLLHFEPDTIYPSQKAYRFKGKVFVIVGNGTFSSAMMMATWIKDNHIAVIAGETPMLGHPNGFGEMYNTRLPNTRITILFGVKRWIRPSGNLKNNVLQPDLQVKLSGDKKEIIRQLITP